MTLQIKSRPGRLALTVRNAISEPGAPAGQPLYSHNLHLTACARVTPRAPRPRAAFSQRALAPTFAPAASTSPRTPFGPRAGPPLLAGGRRRRRMRRCRMKSCSRPAGGYRPRPPRMAARGRSRPGSCRPCSAGPPPQAPYFAAVTTSAGVRHCPRLRSSAATAATSGPTPHRLYAVVWLDAPLSQKSALNGPRTRRTVSDPCKLTTAPQHCGPARLRTHVEELLYQGG